jgi:hypothetical protein
MHRPIRTLKVYLGALNLIYMPIVILIIEVGNRYTYDHILTDVSRTEDRTLSLFFS